MIRIRNIIWILLLVSTFAVAQVKVYVRIASDINEGDSFYMQVVCENANSYPRVDSSQFSEFDPVFAGNSMNSSTTQDSSGRLVQIREVTGKWVLAAGKAGTYTIKSLDVYVDGNKYQTEPVTFTVKKADIAGDYKLIVNSSSKEFYIGQPIALTFKWYLPDNDIRNLEFIVPDLSDESKFRMGPLSPSADGTTKSGEIPPFGDMNYALTKGVRDGSACTVLNFDQYLIAHEPGSYEIAPRVKCLLPSGTRGSGLFMQKEYKPFQEAAESITVNAKPIPEQGKPNDFYGLVGSSYFISTELVNAPDTITVGTPLTLKITVAGNNGFLEDVKMPDLSFMTGSFKIPSDYSAPDRKKDCVVFTQTIRPTKSSDDGLVEIPPIPLSYFNFLDEKYLTEKSEPISIQVEAARKIVEADVRSAVNIEAAQPGGSELERTEHKIAANHFGDELLVNTTFSVSDCFRSTGWLVAMGLPTILLVFSIASTVFGSKDPEKLALKQAGKAFGKAAAGLSRLNEADVDNYLAGLNDILRQYVADKLKHKAQSLTGQDCLELLAAAGVTPDNAQRFKTVVELFEHSRYAGTTASGLPAKQDILELLKAVNKEVTKVKKNR